MHTLISQYAHETLRSVSPVREIMQYANPATLRSLGVDEATFISFGGGWVNHEAPEPLRDAYRRRLDDPALFHADGAYSPTNGEPRCKRALATLEATLFGIAGLDEGKVVIGQSSTHLTSLLFRILLDPGDAVCLLDPSYCNYPLQIRHACPDARILRFPMLDPETFRYLGSDPGTIAALQAFLLERQPKVVLLVSPDNPTGQVLSQALVAACRDAVRTYGGVVVMDFAYKTLVYGEVPDYFRWAPDGHFMSIHSNSKWCHGLGRRLGWVEAPEAVVEAFESLQNASVLCPDRLHQMALADYIEAAAADGTLAAYVDEVRGQYARAAETTVDAIRAHLDVPHLVPQGGLYTCLKVGGNGAAFVDRLLRTQGILLIPGWGFGPSLNASVRLSFGPHVQDPGRIAEGIRRVAAFMGGRA
jgi:aspartate/methionine/tyrosine aminotransferase